MQIAQGDNLLLNFFLVNVLAVAMAFLLLFFSGIVDSTLH